MTLYLKRPNNDIQKYEYVFELTEVFQGYFEFRYILASSGIQKFQFYKKEFLKFEL